MSRYKIALTLESLRQPFKAAVETAARLGFNGMMFDAVGPLAPTELTQTGRREVRARLTAAQLQLAAVGCPLQRGCDKLEGLEHRLAHIQRVMELAFDLGPRLVVIFAGQVAADASDPRRALLRDALTDLARHGDRVGVRLALVAGMEAPDLLREFLAAIDTGSLGISIDPGLLVTQGYDPAAVIRTFRSQVLHCFARDARVTGLDRTIKEVSLGSGFVEWTECLGALEEADYRGWLTIKRDAVADPVQELRNARAFLRRFVG